MRLIVLFLFILPLQAFAAREAVVIAKKAMVYSDINLTSAIGFLRQGKKIAVGEVKRNRGEVVPIVVNNRIAYLRVKDLSIEGDALQEYQGARITEHEYDPDKEKQKFDAFNENNFVHFHFGIVAPQEASLTVMQAVNETPKSATEMGIFVEHRHPLKNYSWGFGAKLFNVASETIKYRTLAIEGRYQWILFRLATFSIGPFMSFFGTGDYRIEVQDVGSYRGAMYGGGAGIEARLFSDKKFSLSVGIQATSQRLNGFDEIQNNENDQVVSAKAVQTVESFAAIVWKF
ncbi:MAG: hypothetical protein COW00_10280 [Bdellovibrio sp. CG12_big_fil_rev_8_21_14_0_65_39_13]|nr:MAG: hypothetical protein COW78_01035 [Bdellovibrio sp. CG22_combo_CG10-13_8_21_14_all_39_27]PIQ59498.1 MAG: hypothetical protein COW00_10280 [Bdellovibrio sp. CG12_big_fil_rev_8_21_14_0_65_39_13]PIR33498.1 MAG: hypothetical protein COV37_16205 [Bdellovibrio sp. CG11_big_fil_rev_8_21_14_0_20_39_38]PJB54140.1 MAG: hypothetical protein CO099_03190 [Bdellovibrio sp. CG_4_9_14_3_um_filter_39_7]